MKNKYNIKIQKFDCALPENKKYNTKYKIDGYPSIIFDNSGEIKRFNPGDYSGRNAESFENFLKDCINN